MKNRYSKKRTSMAEQIFHINNNFSKIFTKKISFLDIAVFFRQLASLIKAGLPIVQCCEILHQTQENILLKNMVYSIKNKIEVGENLSTSLRQFPRYFDEWVCQLIHIGEKSGTLEIMLSRIALYKEKTLAMKNKIKQALFYPIIIFCVAIIVTIIMLIWVIPRFADLFTNMHGHLPALTRFVIQISSMFRDYYLIFVLPICFFLLIQYSLKTSTHFKHRFDHLILKLPGIGNILQKIILSRFARNLALTYSAGLPILESLKLLTHTCGNHDYVIAFLSIQKAVLTGQRLHSAMQGNPLFPSLTIQMIKVGEESGTLEKMLEKIAEIYETDFEYLLSQLGHLLEPLIMVILGALIGGLVIAMYLPIFKLGTLF